MRNSQIAVGMTNESKQQNGLIPAAERLWHCCCGNFSLQVNDASREKLEDAIIAQKNLWKFEFVRYIILKHFIDI